MTYLINELRNEHSLANNYKGLPVPEAFIQDFAAKFPEECNLKTELYKAYKIKSLYPSAASKCFINESKSFNWSSNQSGAYTRRGSSWISESFHGSFVQCKNMSRRWIKSQQLWLCDSQSELISITIRLNFKWNHHLSNDLKIADEIPDELRIPAWSEWKIQSSLLCNVASLQHSAC